MTTKRLLILSCLFLALLFIVHDIHIGSNKTGQTIELTKAFFQGDIPTGPLGETLKNCIIGEKKLDLWKNFSAITESCIARHSKLTESNFFQLNMGRFGESKFFLPMAEEFRGNNSSACYWLTIGIGGDTEVEKEMINVYPQCKIFGIEPSPEQAADFEKYGTVIPLAVGIKPGNLMMRLRQNTGMRYKNKQVPVTPMHQVLDEYIGSRLVHFATLDIEGFEYKILDSLKHGKPIESTGVRFCQIDVELHSDGYQLQNMGPDFKFPHYWRKFLANSSYIPIKAGKFLTHRKVTMINVDDPVCLRLFKFEQYF